MLYVCYFTFENYLEAYNITQPEKDLTVNELKDAFFYLKSNRTPGYDELGFNVIKKCFGNLHKPLPQIFHVSLQNETFPDELEIARVQKQPSRGVLRKRCPENVQRIYRRTPMSKCDIDITLQRGCSLVNLLHIFKTPLPKNSSGRLFARVTPLFKNGSDLDLGNYRPIFLLSCFFKNP